MAVAFDFQRQFAPGFLASEVSTTVPPLTVTVPARGFIRTGPHCSSGTAVPCARRISAQMRAGSSSMPEGLGHVVVGASVDAFDLLGPVVARGQDQNRHVRQAWPRAPAALPVRQRTACGRGAAAARKSASWPEACNKKPERGLNETLRQGSASAADNAPHPIQGTGHVPHPRPSPAIRRPLATGLCARWRLRPLHRFRCCAWPACSACRPVCRHCRTHGRKLMHRCRCSRSARCLQARCLRFRCAAEARNPVRMFASRSVRKRQNGGT